MQFSQKTKLLPDLGLDLISFFLTFTTVFHTEVSFTLGDFQLGRELLDLILEMLKFVDAILTGFFGVVLDSLEHLLVVGLEVSDALLTILSCFLFFKVSDLQ